ncbi:hypothetical protein ACTMSW_11405 [Micromonospora sp. BQ11]|uniref:hypothetical protein n=1 Tax=Micromonospora sp. BQ11 TaxID=3452212 RepID=UPI003F8AABCA
MARAEDLDRADIDLDDEDDEGLDGAEISVEAKAARFLTALNLPVWRPFNQSAV